MGKGHIDRFYAGVVVVFGKFDSAFIPCDRQFQSFFGHAFVDCFGQYYALHAIFQS
jgi:hypothetical protein